ncbi:MAG: DNA primase large subunit PriL [Halobacteriales archaeon]|nr:DNA primase large subunit PriL [Halobacteriales archaeon]
MALPLPLLARYPFLPGAAEHVEQAGPKLEELLFDRAYARVRERGLERVERAMREAEIPAATVASDPEALVELLSYGVGRMVVACMGMPYAARRSAMAEAKLAHARLLQEDEAAVRLVAGTLGLKLNGGAVHVADFLKHSVAFKEEAWKLVNQPLRAGYVELDKQKLARLCQEAVRQRVELAGSREPSAEMERAFGEHVPGLRKLAEEQLAKFQGGDLGPVRLELLPPCMARLLAQLQQGVNVPHTGRFAVTSFLHTIGMGSEEIMRLFAQAPDFKEELTRYQVEHITGKSSGTEYTPPGCGSMVTWGICPMEEKAREDRDPICVKPRMTHPLIYYRIRSQRAGLAGPPLPAPPAAEPAKE